MSSYGRYEQRKGNTRRKNEPHPIWRGIGCLITLIVPVLAYVLATIAVDYAMKQGIRLPDGLVGTPVMPTLLFKVPGLVDILLWIEGRTNLYAYLFMTFFFIVALGGVMSLLYAIMYQIVGPKRYTVLDAPPPSVKTRKYKR
jgi:drug/metabolite transporter (DMT)-like permease